MKKLMALVLVLSMVCALSACHRSKDSSVNYSANLETDEFYNIGAYASATSNSPVIVSDADNIGDVYIRLVDGDGGVVGSVIVISPGQTVALDDISAISGTCTIQGKAVETNGEYIFTVK